MGVTLLIDQHEPRLLAIKDFDDSGQFVVGSAAPLSQPCGLCMDSQGNVIIADSGKHCLVVRDLWSASWSTFGSSGRGAGEFNAPTAVATDSDDRLYVVDAGNHRIVRMGGLDGSDWVSYGEAGKPSHSDSVAAGKLAGPRGIAIDGRGRICVTDPAAGRAIRTEDMDGAGWSVLPLPAGRNSTRPFGIAAGPDQLAVSDVGNAMIYVLDLDNRVIATLEGRSMGMPVPAYLAYDHDRLVVADIVSNELRRFRIDRGGFVLEKTLRGSSPANLTPLFQQIGGISSGAR